MNAAVRRVALLLAVLALAGSLDACGSDSDGTTADGDQSGQATTDTGGGASTGGDGDTGGGGNTGGRSQDDGDDEEIRDEEPTANNEVLLGAAFFGEQPANFGAVAVGETHAISFRLDSLGVSRTINATSIVGDHAGDFSLAPGTCANGAVVGAGSSCTLSITFAPSAAGIRKASLRVEIDPGVPGGRSLTGNGGADAEPPAGDDTDPDATSGEQTEGPTDPGAGDTGATTGPLAPEATDADGN